MLLSNFKPESAKNDTIWVQVYPLHMAEKISHIGNYVNYVRVGKHLKYSCSPAKNRQKVKALCKANLMTHKFRN